MFSMKSPVVAKPYCPLMCTTVSTPFQAGYGRSVPAHEFLNGWATELVQLM